MAKAGLPAETVAAMCHAELMAWFDDVLASLGIKQPKDDGVIISQRHPKPST
ncbi:TetR family transcriptional regulator [Neisseria sp. S1]|uniref:TetR family transcriptional regulator n=1 Tax=Neisseria sp. S1 TaxID=3318354 RepID=UPI003A89622F